MHPTREGVVPGGPLSLLHPPKTTAVASPTTAIRSPLVVRLSVGSGMSLKQFFTVWTIYTGRKGGGGGRTREHDGTMSPALSVGKSEMPSIDDGRFVPLAKHDLPSEETPTSTQTNQRAGDFFPAFQGTKQTQKIHARASSLYGAYHGNVVLSEKCYPHGSLIECRPQKKALETLFAGKPKKLRSRCDLQKGWPVKKWMRRNCNINRPADTHPQGGMVPARREELYHKRRIQLQASVHPRGQPTRTPTTAVVRSHAAILDRMHLCT